MKLAKLSGKLQVKFNQFSQRYTEGFTVPVKKFIRQMLFGILKSGKVQINSIAQSLQEKISLKKTAKRLGMHLAVPGSWLEISGSTLRT